MRNDATTHPLDNPAYASLAGPHSRFAERSGAALRYPADVSPFVALPENATATDWRSLATLTGPGERLIFAGVPIPVPDDWEVATRVEGVQMIGSAVDAAPDPQAIRLHAADVPEMLALVDATKPGPFRLRTIELGTYLGIRLDGALVAMAGERMRPPGWTEISAVCTAPEYRGRGLAARLIRAIAAEIRARGDVPFLHAAAANTNAIGLYESLGFTLRRHAPFLGVRVPEPLHSAPVARPDFSDAAGT